jgi:predicted metal-dependent HD superfamily phosphohydrolase
VLSSCFRAFVVHAAVEATHNSDRKPLFTRARSVDDRAMSGAVLFSPSRNWSQIHARLKPRYDEPHRHYHAWPHIESLLEWFVEVHEHLIEPDSVHFAILYHDAIYDPTASDNEAKSAELFRGEWGGSLAPPLLHAVDTMILATTSHELEPLNAVEPEPLVNDCSYFLDMDLAILGAPREAFETYNSAIRKEYVHVPDDAFRIGRTNVLERILKRPRLYFTEYFFERLELTARDNLTRAIKALER